MLRCGVWSTYFLLDLSVYSVLRDWVYTAPAGSLTQIAHTFALDPRRALTASAGPSSGARPRRPRLAHLHTPWSRRCLLLNGCLQDRHRCQRTRRNPVAHLQRLRTRRNPVAYSVYAIRSRGRCGASLGARRVSRCAITAAPHLIEPRSPTSEGARTGFGVSPVTAADFMVQVLTGSLAQAFPHDRFIAEETGAELAASGEATRAAVLSGLFDHSGHDQRSGGPRGWTWCDGLEDSWSRTGRTWVLDPVDGTKGFYAATTLPSHWRCSMAVSRCLVS